MSSEEDVCVFVCPECETTTEVNGPMKAALIENGCVVCGATVTADAFTETSIPGSS